jgi:hypothetical protein
MLDPGLISTIASFLGLSADKLYSLSKSYLVRRNQQKRAAILAERIIEYRKIVSNGTHTDLLSRIYTNESFTKLGLSRYVLHLGCRELRTANIVGPPEYLKLELDLQENNVNCSVINEVPSNIKLDSKLAAEVMADIEFRNLKVWDQPIYRLKSINIKNSVLDVIFSIDSFMKFRLSWGALWDELIDGIIAEPNINKIFDSFSRYLPKRYRYLPDSKCFAEIDKRICASGIHATFAIKRPDPWDDYVIPIQRRSSHLSGGQGMLSIIPQAYHQPTIDPEGEKSFSHTFYREIYEELFGGSEAIKDTKRLRHDWYIELSEPIKWFMENRGGFRLICTGMGYNLVSGNYEVALICLIRDLSYWNRFSHLMLVNWESSDELCPLVSTKDAESIRQLLSRNDWDGTSFFSFSRALEYIMKSEHGNITDLISDWKLD